MNSSVIFVTLKDGEYNDYWSSELVPLLTSDTRAGYRELHWCGQRKKSPRDGLVAVGTIVAVRPNSKTPEFTIVGTVCQKECITQKTATQPATYKLLVDMKKYPVQIVRSVKDRCVHWTVLRELGIPHSGGFMPEGIYSC